MQMRCVYTSIHKLLLSSTQLMIMSQNHLQTLLKILTLSFLFFLIKSNANEIDKNCASQTCNGLTIGYPFWRLNNNATNNSSSQHCGYQGFGVNCSSPNPIFYLNREAYDIKSISYQNHNFTLVDNDVENQTCPRALHNISLGQLPLSYSTSDLNLSFHLNCGPLTSDIAPLPVPCLDVGTNRSYMTVGTVLFFEDCAEKIVSTVIQSQINIYDVTTDFGRAMGLGFSLDWNPTAECRRCEASKGRCGYDSAVDRFLCYCSDGVTNSGQCKGSHSSSLDLKIGIGLGAAVIGLLLCCFMITYTTNTVMFIWTWRTINDENVEAFILQCGTSSPKRYTYSDIKKMTNSFKHELGRGGYGNVYKGSLKDGRLVAVKVLNPLKGNGEEFMNEVASIGRTSHVNIVKLLGFCYEGRRRALIYDFMPNGSLDTFIYAHIGKGDHEQLGVEKLYEIALGIARGLEYLHHGCNTRILHLDIKPQNILLDELFSPKVADFGLAKLYTKEESIMSMLEARGTIGYIAPEVFNKSFGGVSHKSDVYSYGMLVMEIIGGRCSVDLESVHTSDTYFPHLVYKYIEKNEELQLQGPMSPEGNEVAKKMTLVGLWCIQTNPSQRPSMKKVIEMLEGRLEDLEIPPKPFLSSPPRSEASSFTSSVSL